MGSRGLWGSFCNSEREAADLGSATLDMGRRLRIWGSAGDSDLGSFCCFCCVLFFVGGGGGKFPATKTSQYCLIWFSGGDELRKTPCASSTVQKL